MLNSESYFSEKRKFDLKNFDLTNWTMAKRKRQHTAAINNEFDTEYMVDIEREFQRN